ncbi:MAG: hypothetical protein JKY37_16595 [Nannocystaceae bacterium]|nr:hypothetical protein [Nannocystaceae bacterium]
MRVFGWWMVVVGLPACGPSLSDESGSGDGTSASAETSGEATEASASGAMSGAMTAASQDTTPQDTAADTTGSAVACGDFDDDIPPPVTFSIEIRNVGAEAVLLDDPCFSRAYLQIQTAQDWRWPSAFCRETCQNEFAGGCIDCGACEIAAYTVLPPDTSLIVEWGGVLYEDIAAPEECFEGASCEPTCQRARVPGSETLSMVVQAITQSDCVAGDPDPETSCTCPPGPEGWCQTSGQIEIESTLQATGEFTFDSGEAFVLEIGG